MKPRLFIGSSTESVNIAYAVQQNLRDSAEVTVWDQGVFKLSAPALESLLKILDTSDFGMFIFSPDDVLTIRGDENASVRDNVVFELGLFFGRLGKGRCFILTPDDATDLRIPTDLLGISPGTYEANRSDGNLIAATAPASHMIQEQIQELGLAAQRTESPSVTGIPDEQNKNLESEALTGKPTTTKAESEAVDETLLWLPAYVHRQFDKALDLLGRRIDEEADPDEQLRLKAWRGRVKYRMDPNEGTLELERLIRKHPKESDPYIHLAYAHLNRDLYEPALRVIEDGLSNANDKHELLEAKAGYYSKLGADDQAEETRKDAVRQLTGLPDPYIYLSEHYQGQKQYEDARSVLEEAIQEVPENERLLSSYARLITDHFEAKEALPVYNDLVSLSPDSEQYRTLRANLFLQLGLTDRAMSDYEHANDLADEKQAWILGNIGNLFKNRGFYEEAISYLKRALEIEPDDEYAHERLAQTLKLRTEEQKKADEILKEIERSTAERRRTQDEAPPAQT